MKSPTNLPLVAICHYDHETDPQPTEAWIERTLIEHVCEGGEADLVVGVLVSINIVEECPNAAPGGLLVKLKVVDLGEEGAFVGELQHDCDLVGMIAGDLVTFYAGDVAVLNFALPADRNWVSV